MNIKILLAAILISISAQVQAQTGLIQGKVITSDGEPAAFVNVVLKDENKGTQSNHEGHFALNNLRSGIYTVIISFTGLETQQHEVSVSDQSTTLLSVTLKESAQQLQEITVTETRSMNERPVSIGKLAVNPMDLPQSIVVIDKDVLIRQQSLHLGDVLMNTNGVYMMGTTGGTQEEIAGRGFSFGSSNTFKNGTRFNNAIMPEVSALERVEIMKGSTAILFGNVAAGGVINLVTKKPKFSKGGELSFRTGSYNLYKPTVDIYGAIGDSRKVAYRINASYENAGSFRDNVKSERIYFNPSILYKINSSTEVLIEGDYLKDDRTLDYGTAAINYKIANLPRGRFLGATWSYYKGEQKSLSISSTHHFNAEWNLHVLASYQGYTNDQYGTTRPNASGHPVLESGLWVRGLQRSGTNQDYYIAQADLTGKFSTGSIKHNLLVGADLDKYRTNSNAYAYVNPLISGKDKNIYDTINVFDENGYIQRQDIPAIDKTTLTKNPINRVGAYLQDLVSITPSLKVLAGIRYSYIESESNVYTYATKKTAPSAFHDGAFTPRFGVVYQPKKEVSLFASYSNSFNLNTVKDTTNKTLPPSFIDQYEVGIKNELFQNAVSLNITAYKIINSNSPQPLLPSNPKFPNAQELGGEITSKGIEIDLMTKEIHGFNFIAGYSYNETRYTKSTQYVKNSLLRYNPQHTANASFNYTVKQGSLKGFTAGLIGMYTGKRVAGRSTTIANPLYKLMPIPRFVQLDATVGYTFNTITIRLKASNILNKQSYYVHDDNSVNPIAPRLYSASISFKL